MVIEYIHDISGHWLSYNSYTITRGYLIVATNSERM